jgi:hypothetical protein
MSIAMIPINNIYIDTYTNIKDYLFVLEKIEKGQVDSRYRKKPDVIPPSLFSDNNVKDICQLIYT